MTDLFDKLFTKNNVLCYCSDRQLQGLKKSNFKHFNLDFNKVNSIADIPEVKCSDGLVLKNGWVNLWNDQYIQADINDELLNRRG